MRWLSKLAAWLVTCTATLVVAQEIELPVQRSHLAGYRYYAAPALRDRLRAPEQLLLVRDPANPFDGNAIRVEWQGHMIGYVPRTQNAALAWIMDRGVQPRARIAPRGSPRARRIEFEVYFQ